MAAKVNPSDAARAEIARFLANHYDDPTKINAKRLDDLLRHLWSLKPGRLHPPLLVRLQKYWKEGREFAAWYAETRKVYTDWPDIEWQGNTGSDYERRYWEDARRKPPDVHA